MVLSMVYALCYVVKLKIFTLFWDYNKIEIDNNEEREAHGHVCQPGLFSRFVKYIGIFG